MPPTPAGAEILQAGGRGGTGNVLFVFRSEQPPVVLKVYRTRRSRSNELLKNFSERNLEGKRGATAAIRQATEKLSIDLWSREGFDVVPRVEKPLPAGITLPAFGWFTAVSRFCGCVVGPPPRRGDEATFGRIAGRFHEPPSHTRHGIE